MSVVIIKFIDVIGYSGSGKTYIIMNMVKMFKNQLNYNVAVIKNVKHHHIDDKGKDSHKFTESGATYSVIKNINNEFGVFLKINNDSINLILRWLQKGPLKIDLIITEGFRNLNHPTVLCVKDLEEIDPQLDKNVKVISGIICLKQELPKYYLNLPILDIEKKFKRFLEIFKF
ncbi:MAG: molybdopterin-guanine dinucleotide biosynthesis protein MobB [Promethearchaeota archaeon]|jgi:molybdopterin-guanine dinucleotide biosynthesis protein B